MFTTLATTTALDSRSGTDFRGARNLLAREALLAPVRKPAKRPRLRIDLDRRRREALSREFASRVTEHARWLPASDLALLNWVYRSERPLTELAATGFAPRWVLHRRLNRIVARVLSPAYRHVASLLTAARSAPEWPPVDRMQSEDAFVLVAARGLFINGLPVREVARVLNASRQRITRIRELISLQAEAQAIVAPA